MSEKELTLRMELEKLLIEIRNDGNESVGMYVTPEEFQQHWALQYYKLLSKIQSRLETIIHSQ